MTLLTRLQAIQNNVYSYETKTFLRFFGNKGKKIQYSISLEMGLSESEISAFAERSPNQHIPQEIRELLAYTRGFTFDEKAGLIVERVAFNDLHYDSFGGLEDGFFPCVAVIAVDGSGNDWVVDIQPNGSWGAVFYVCHDPAAIVKQAENIAQFIQQCDEHMQQGESAFLYLTHEFEYRDLYNDFLSQNQAMNSTDEVLRQFATRFADNFFFIDLRNQPIGTGFSIDKITVNGETRVFDYESAKRHDFELIWAFRAG